MLIYLLWMSKLNIFASPCILLDTDWNFPCRFKCVDLDGNGVITSNEMQFFFEEQLHRMECITQEAVLFSDILCQIIDMIGPEVSYFTNQNMVVW